MALSEILVLSGGALLIFAMAWPGRRRAGTKLNSSQPCSGLDVSPLWSLIRQLRLDPTTRPHRHRLDPNIRCRLLNRARLTVIELPFFRRQQPDRSVAEQEHHAAQV